MPVEESHDSVANGSVALTQEIVALLQDIRDSLAQKEHNQTQRIERLEARFAGAIDLEINNASHLVESSRDGKGSLAGLSAFHGRSAEVRDLGYDTQNTFFRAPLGINIPPIPFARADYLSQAQQTPPTTSLRMVLNLHGRPLGKASGQVTCSESKHPSSKLTKTGDAGSLRICGFHQILDCR
jgi:hypothetical protein